MNVQEERICRLCLKVAENKFGIVDGLEKQLFDALLLKLDLEITKDFIVCEDCIEVTKKCLCFKSTCIGTERIILSFFTEKPYTKCSIKVIYKKREHAKVNDEGLDICRFCLAQSDGTRFVLFTRILDETMLEMLTTYMPEMDLNNIEDPVICTTCTEDLKDYCKFLLNCLNIEGKLKAYCRKEGIDSMSHVDLMHFLLCKDILQFPDECPQIYAAIKQESNILEDTDYAYPESYRKELIKLEEEFDIKEEIKLVEDSNSNLSEVMLDTFDKETKSDMLLIKYGAINNERKLNKNVSSDLMVNNDAEVSIYEYIISKSDVNKMKNREDASGSKEKNNVNKYRCSLCPYEAECKDDFKKHLFLHNDLVKTFNCSLCAYKGKRKGDLKYHMLVHRDASEIEMHKCSLCTYEGKRKCDLNKHMLIHMDVSEIKMHKCSLCAYEGKRKTDLNYHMLTHKDVSEIKMYKCSLCVYQAKQKNHLDTHMLTHKNFSEIQMLKCPLCTYETKYKSSFKRHKLVHIDVSEIKMYKCSLCAYGGKRKSDLKRHMLVHTDVSEIKMYKCRDKCSLCSYEGKRKDDLNYHMLVHKDVTELKMFKCLLCAYQAKHKSNLKTHMLVHKDVSEIQMHKCSLCPYKAKQKGQLKTHNMLMHKDITEITTFKCSLCTYEAKLKGRLKSHMLVHRKAFEIEMYKCSLCAYKAKYKNSLQKHMLIHKGISK